MLQDQTKAVGTLQIVLTDEHGNVKLVRNEKNIVTDTGKAFIAQRMAGINTATMNNMAIGTSTTAPVTSQLTLGSETARAALTATQNANTVTYTASFGAGAGTGAVTEAGIFNSATTNQGAMLNRTTFAAINKGASDTISITWTVTLQ